MKAYITLVSTDDFVLGAVALYLSLKKAHTKYPFYVLLSDTVSLANEKKLLKIDGIQIIKIDVKNKLNFSSNMNPGSHRWNNTFDKLSIFSLSQFKKMIFLDCDTYIIENIDYLFEKKHMSAVYIYDTYQNPIKEHKFCAVVIVFEPSYELFIELKNQFYITSKNHLHSGIPFGDQDVLNDYYPDWDSDSSRFLFDEYNAMWGTMEKLLAKEWTLNNEKDKTQIKVIHFTGILKPWMNMKLFYIKTIIRAFRHYHKFPNLLTLKILSNYFKLVKQSKDLLRND